MEVYPYTLKTNILCYTEHTLSNFWFYYDPVTVKNLNIGTSLGLDSDQTALKEQSDQNLHCLPFFLHLLEAFFHCKIKLF